MLALALTERDVARSLESARLFFLERQRFLVARLTQVLAERPLAEWGEAFERQIAEVYLGRFDDDEVEEALLAYIRLAWERDDRFLRQQYQELAPQTLSEAWPLYPSVPRLFAELTPPSTP